MKSYERLILLVLLALAVIVALSGTAHAAGFSDVPPSHPYFTAISDLAGRQVINGFTDGTFRPDNPVTRQQFAKMIVKSLGLPVSAADTDPFTDVPTGQDPSDPFYPDKYVAVVWKNGITAGKTATTFAPADHLTSAQLVTLVARAAQLPDPPADYTPPFGDFSPVHYPWARKAAYAGLLAGLQGLGETFDFTKDATRGECAQLLHNLLVHNQTGNFWRNLNPSGTVPPARYGHSMVYLSAGVSGKTILFGGETTVGPANDTWVYERTTNTWTELSPSGPLPSPRQGQAMVYDPANGQVIMFGGQGSAGYMNDTWAYDPAANTWTNLNPSGQLPSARVYHSMAFDPVSGKVILFGGFGGAPDFLFDTWAYDPSANTWTQLHPSGSVPPARDLSAMAYDPPTAKMILFGGLGTGGDLNDTWAYDPAANSWTNLNPAGPLPTARRGHAMVYIYVQNGGKMIMEGGRAGRSPNDEDLDDTEVFDPFTLRWVELAPRGPVPAARDGHAMVLGGSAGEVILFGGIGNADTPFADTWAYTP